MKTRRWVFLGIAAAMLFDSAQTFIYAIFVSKTKLGWLRVIQLTATSALTAAIIVRIRAAYRKHPPPWTGRWQLTIADFYVVILLNAVLLSLWMAAGKYFLAAGIVRSILMSIEMLLFLLAANRIGCASLSLRAHYALSLLLIVQGLHLFGSTLLTTIRLTIVMAPMAPYGWMYGLSYWLDALKMIFLGDASMPQHYKPITWVLRFQFIALPIGVILLRWAKRRLARQRAAASNSNGVP